MALKTVAIIGGGTLGTQAALQFAIHGKEVHIFVRSTASRERAALRLQRFAEIYAAQPNFDANVVHRAHESIEWTTELSQAAAADLIFECLPEDPAVKQEFLGQLSEHVSADTVVATNSSTLLPSALVVGYRYPENFLAVHLANEIWSRNTAEIMPQSQTDPEVVAALEGFATEVGLIAIPLSKEHPGYLLNSMIIPFTRSGLDLLVAGVAGVAEIDRCWEAVMHSYGPMKVLDVIGLRTTVAVLEQEAANGVPGSAEIAALLRQRYLAHGYDGVESGKGFYDYTGTAPVVNPVGDAVQSSE